MVLVEFNISMESHNSKRTVKKDLMIRWMLSIALFVSLILLKTTLQVEFQCILFQKHPVCKKRSSLELKKARMKKN